MPCTVKKTFEAARDTGNVLIAQIKDNQPTLHAAIQTLCATLPVADRAQTVDRNKHGRQEHRLVETFDVSARLGPDWDGLIVTAARVSRLTWRKDTTSGGWNPTSETSLYACQAAISATAAGAAIRAHWGIENRNHYVRDMSFFEDHSRIRTKPTIFARCRSFALNILRANRTENISRELYLNALNFDHAMTYPIT